MPLVAGQAVEALWPEDGEWYNAVVRAVTNQGIELDYEDGDFRADATEAEIRVKEAVATEDDDWLNDIIDAPDPEPEKAIEVSADMAHLDAELDDGLGDLLDDIIDDGDAPGGEPSRPAPGDEPAPAVAAPGEVAATIAAAADADEYRADFSLEQDVTPNAVVGALDPRAGAAGVLQGAVRRHSARKRGSAQEWKLALMVGTVVEARFGGDDAWFPGTVEAVNEDGTYVIAYDDGDREADVAPALVRAVAEPADAAAGAGVVAAAGVAPEAAAAPAAPEPTGAPAAPAAPEPEPVDDDADPTDGVFNLTAIHERKELPAPRRLDMNANAGAGEKPLRRRRLEPKNDVDVPAKPRPRPASAGAARAPAPKLKKKKRRPRSAAARRKGPGGRGSDASFIEGLVASTPSQLGYGSRLWDGVKRWIDERELEQILQRKAEDAAPPPPPARRRRPRSAGAGRPRSSPTNRVLEARPPPTLVAGAPAPAPAPAPPRQRSPERRPAPMPPGHLMNGVLLKLKKPARRRARDIQALERGFTLRI